MVRVLVAGCGNMGTSHAHAYKSIDGFELAGLVSRSPQGRESLAAKLGVEVPLYAGYQEALAASDADAVAICTYPDTHAEYAIQALEAGKHVFLEKPIANTVEDAGHVVRAARASGRKLVIGYILRHHPSWMQFVEIARTLGKPLVMRMNLNQQSSGTAWTTHRSLMASISPMVDCGVHYVDVMCQMTRSRPVRVHAIGARLSEDLDEGMYNYGMLQVQFEDGSCGWYEAGWGPMMSETAFFVKDVIGPQGSVSIKARQAGGEGQSDHVGAHTRTESLLLHHGDVDSKNRFTREDEWIDVSGEPDHDELCVREQRFFLQAIREDLDLEEHMSAAVDSLRIVLAADESFRTGRSVNL